MCVFFLYFQHHFKWYVLYLSLACFFSPVDYIYDYEPMLKSVACLQCRAGRCHTSSAGRSARAQVNHPGLRCQWLETTLEPGPAGGSARAGGLTWLATDWDRNLCFACSTTTTPRTWNVSPGFRRFNFTVASWDETWNPRRLTSGFWNAFAGVAVQSLQEFWQFLHLFFLPFSLSLPRSIYRIILTVYV